MKKIALIILIALSPFFVKAQISEKWWLKSSFEDSVKTFKHHTSLNYNYSNINSTIKNSNQFGVVNVILRKNNITNISVYTLSKMHLKLDVPIILDYSTTAQYLTNFSDLDFTKSFYGQMGFIWERDDVLLLQNRYTFYAGIGMKKKFFEKIKIKTLLACGRLNQNYTIPVEQIDVIKEPYWAGYLRLNYEYPINQNISFSGHAIYFSNLTDTERFRYNVDFNIQIALIKHINLNIGYTYKYDKELELLGITPITGLQNLGVVFYL